jgi:pimeloyl-ACP methyl ester carboxylesterase
VKVIIDGIATEYQDSGQGPALLMLHGWKTNLHSFDDIASILVDRYRVVRLDLPGFGQTEMPGQSWSLSSYVKFVADFIEKLGLGDPYLVGHSFGGRIVIKGVATGKFHPCKVVLVASAGIAKTKSLRNQSFKVAAKIGKALTSIPPLTFVRDTLRSNLYALAGSDYLGAGDLRSVYLDVINEDLSKAAADVHVPTLLVWGSDDAETPLSDGKGLAAVIENSRLEVLQGKGHFVFQEEPAKVAQLMEEFLA